ncbi:alpha/beta hydrolase [Brucella sp. BE17]|uniref:alpha/beta hydrolase n=1 Tax=Brucella sp. BE17 TaxID=3142977 RepID=UPI0031BB9331
MPFETIHRLALAHSSQLPFRCLLANQAQGIVQICHGLAEHSARYQRFAAALSYAGYHVYAHDHRGHGVNIDANTPKGMFALRDGHRAAINDVLALNTYIHQSHPGLPIILFGHSMGGLIALNYILDHAATVDATAMWNTNVSSQLENRTALALLYMERMLKGSDVPSAMLPKLTFRAWGNAIADKRTDFDWLSRDTQEVDAYIADPLCGFDASVSMWIDIFRMMQRGLVRDNFANIPKNMPFHFLGGGADPATNNGKAVQRLAARMQHMGFTDVDCVIQSETRHESLNECNHDQSVQIFLDWLRKNLPSAAFSR